ncbi:MAG: hypothetical protein V2I57_04420 [Xanthomonadales bacterium]|nr:hypothetical protein [Xanthomonadales bacterium]
MKPPRLLLTLILPVTCLLAACAGQPTEPSAGGFKPIEVVHDDDRTVVYPVTGFKADLLDNEYQCRLWAFGRDGRNTRPCAGEVPTCGAPIPFSQVTVLNSPAQQGNASTALTVDFPDLVTEGVYRARIQATVQDTTRQLARQIAREGCDLLIVEGEEWVSLERRHRVRYLQVRWGSKDSAALDQAAP